MARIVMFAIYPESGKMVGCSNARYVAGNIAEGLIPSICLKGTKCKCLSGGRDSADGGGRKMSRLRTGKRGAQ